jgi:carboxyl-terminal processing protease
MRLEFTFAATLVGLMLAWVAYAEERFAGIGIQAALKHNALTVIHVIPDSPASKAGLSEGLIIQKIDGAETAGKSLAECVDLIRGKVGTKVKLELADLTHSKTNSVVLTRATVKPNVLGGAANPSK